jgi:PAS domain S-box-containing protein
MTMTEAQSQRQAPMPRIVTLYVASVAIAATAVAFINLPLSPERSPAWLALIPFFALLVIAERLDVRFRSGGHVESVNLVEAVLAPLLFAFPGPAVAGLATVAWLTLGVMRRNHPIKALFNASSWALAAGCAALIFALLQPDDTLTFRSLVALLIAMIVVGVVNQALLTIAMALAQGRRATEVVQNLAPVIVPGWIVGWGLNTLVGFLFVFAYDSNAASVLLFFVPLGVLYAAYRGYAGTESDRMRLGGLHRASRLLSVVGEKDGSVADFLSEVSRCFEAGAAELVLVTEEGIVVHRVRSGRRDTYIKEIDGGGSESLHSLLLSHDHTFRTSIENDSEVSAALGAAGWRDCLMSPLPGDHSVSGALVVYDQNGIEGFEEGERAVLEALARETASSFEKGRLFQTVIQERERLTQMVDTTSDGVLTITSTGVVRTWNPGWEQITQCPATAAVGRVISETIGIFDNGGHEVDLTTWADNIERLPRDVQVFDRQGMRHWLECSYQVQATDGSAARVLVIVAHDTSDERQIEQLREDVDRLAELEAAQRARVLQLQESLQPEIPEIPQTEFGVFYLPSDTSAPTGGDFYDWQRLPSGDVHVAVVDVLGSGVEATNDAFAVIHTLRTLAFQGVPVEHLVREADHLLASLNNELVATVICVRYNPETGRARLAGGGHPPPLLVRGGGDVTEVAAPGVPIGWPGAGSDHAVDIQLSSSDTLLLYTDGLVEAHRDILLGLDALAKTAAQTRSLPAGRLARELVERSLEGAARRDDSLALVLRHRSPVVSGHHVGFQHKAAPAVDQVPLVRHRFSEWIVTQGDVAQLEEEFAVVVSELVTNAVRLATTFFEVRATVAEDGVVLEVIDDGPGFHIDETVTDEPDFDGESGRGLFIVECIVDELAVEPREPGSIVRVFKKAPLAMPAADVASVSGSSIK